MTVCRFFQKGYCKFGDRCVNEHPGKNAPNSRNPFAPLQNHQSGGSGSSVIRGTSSNRDLPYKLSKSSIVTDLSKEHPQWILSSYGPGVDAPIQLFGGYPREQSFEELRARHYELAGQGNVQQAINEAQSLVQNAEQQMQAVLKDVDEAINYITNGENQHPNRIDICKVKGTSLLPQAVGFNPQSTSTFRQPSNLGSTFRQSPAPSAFGNVSAPTFGQPSKVTSSLTQAPTTSFGPSPAFGQPSGIGRPTTAFGQPSSTFGKPSGPVSTLAQSSGFAALASSRQNQSPFGTLGSSQAGEARNPFGQPLQASALGQSGIFGKPSAPSSVNPFGQPADTTVGSGSIQGVPPIPFGQPAAPASLNPFGQPRTAAPSIVNSSKARISFANRAVPDFGFSFDAFKASMLQLQSTDKDTAPTTSAPPANGLVNNPLNRQVASGGEAQKDSQGRVRSWNGKAVSYINDEPCFKGSDGAWQRIWFPDGPPIFTKTVDLPDEMYDDDMKENYRLLKENRTFKDSIMPDLPPKRAWCSWNF